MKNLRAPTGPRSHGLAARALVTLLALSAGPLLVPGVACAQASIDTDEYAREDLFELVRSRTPGVDQFALPPMFRFPDHARQSSTFGVDFSHHVEDRCKCVIDWGKVVAQRVQFVYLKATQGAAYTDPSMARNVAALQQVDGLPTGVYHFFTATDDAAAQAAHFIAATKDVGALALSPSLDLEWQLGPMRPDCPADGMAEIRGSKGEIVRKCDRWSEVAARDIITRVNLWLDTVREAVHREPVLYTSRAWWQERIGDETKIEQIRAKLIWVADYSKEGLATEKPRVPNGRTWDLWQFTDAAILPTHSPPISMDASIFDGDLVTFETRLGSADSR